MTTDVLGIMSKDTNLEGLPGLIDWIDVTPDRRRLRNFKKPRTAEQRSYTSQSGEEMEVIKPLDTLIALNKAHVIKAESQESFRRGPTHEIAKASHLTNHWKDGKRKTQRAEDEAPRREAQNLQAIAELEHRNRELEAQARVNEDSRIMLESRLASEQKLLQRQNLQIEELQKGLNNMISHKLRGFDTSWLPDSIDEIDRKLKIILSAVKQWSEKHAEVPFDKVIWAMEKDDFKQILLETGCTTVPDSLRWKLLAHRPLQRGSKAAAMLLAAAVSCELFRTIFGCPFFAFVGAEDQEEVLRHSQSRAVEGLLDLMQDNEAGMHTLRSQLFQLLDPPDAKVRCAHLRSKQVAANSRRAAAHEFAKSCVQKFEGWLMPNDRVEEAFHDLLGIAISATELSWTLWARTSVMRVLGLRELSDPGQSGPLYQAGSERLQASPLHHVDLDDDEHALDGHRVLLMCSPAVEASGNGEGENYHITRVWKKAVVWLE